MFNMSNLFEKYRSAGNDEAALMVANNEFNKAPGDKAAFEQYFSFVCSLGTSLPSLLDRQAALDKAAVALEYFKENAELDEKLVEWILAKQTSLEDCYEALAREDNGLMKKQALDVENENNTVLKRLFDLRDELQEVKTRDAFDDVLNRIRLEDGKLDQDAFTEEQKRVYDTLSRAHTSLITGKTAELEREENMDYNSRAVSFFADAFSKFKKDENRYTKNEDALKSLADTYLFAFDANRLLPATVAYYNYIYQYIFDKLSEDGKLFLTRLATEKDRTRW